MGRSLVLRNEESTYCQNFLAPFKSRKNNFLTKSQDSNKNKEGIIKRCSLIMNVKN